MKGKKILQNKENSRKLSEGKLSKEQAGLLELLLVYFLYVLEHAQR